MMMYCVYIYKAHTHPSSCIYAVCFFSSRAVNRHRAHRRKQQSSAYVRSVYPLATAESEECESRKLFSASRKTFLGDSESPGIPTGRSVGRLVVN